MTPQKKKRFGFIIAALSVLGLAVALILSALEENIVYFRSPTDLIAQAPSPQKWRLGGLVQTGSVSRGADGLLTFSVTDGNNSIKVSYKGFVPDLFREGQGVVVEGHIEQAGVIKAQTLLARHDENYMPPEVAAALKQSGHWKNDGGYPAKPAEEGNKK